MPAAVESYILGVVIENGVTIYEGLRQNAPFSAAQIEAHRKWSESPEGRAFIEERRRLHAAGERPTYGILQWGDGDGNYGHWRL